MASSDPHISFGQVNSDEDVDDVCATPEMEALEHHNVGFGLRYFWPLGLALLVYILWGDDIRRAWRNMDKPTHQKSSTDAAFDDQRKPAGHQPEEEQTEFTDYIAGLRRARDKQEFDRFMARREAS